MGQGDERRSFRHRLSLINKTPAGVASGGCLFSSPGKSKILAELVHCIVDAARLERGLASEIFLMIIANVRA
jgi:hypothetical protein